MLVLLPNKWLYDVAIRIANVHLHNAITARAWSTNDFNIVSLQVPARFFQAGNLEGNMRCIANGQFLGPVAAGLYLGSPSSLGFTNQVDLSAPLPEQGPR